MLIVSAPAKLNLFLHVTGRRHDGMHLLESLFVLVTLGDRITLARRDDGRIVRSLAVAEIPHDADLMVRAATLLQDASGTRSGVELTLDKRIPIGGGMGGGSSDAASVLLALNRLWQLEWPRTRLEALALELGADVPFFIRGEPALARGVGEVLMPMTVPASWFAIAAPPVQIATASMFAAPELTRCSTRAKMNVFSESYGRNDLQAVAVSRHPAVAEAIGALEEAGGEARMTGSGACVFARARSRHEAERLLSFLRCRLPEARGYVTRTLMRHPLAHFAA